MNFSWVPFYRELAGKVLEFEDRQNELIDVLWGIKDDGLPCIPLADNQPDKTQKPLEVIDPFTFLAVLARVETASAIRLCEWLKRKWNLASPIPTHFEGRAVVQARGGGSWFFGSVESGRQPQDVGNLWALAKQAYGHGIEDIDFSLFRICITHNNLSLRKLTNGLSWLSPEFFLPLGGSMLEYLRSQNVQFDQRAIAYRDADAYRQLMNNAQKLGTSYVALTAEAAKTKFDEDTDEDAVEVLSPGITPTPPSITSLNQILYGPPGTGKTFTSVAKAVALIDGLAPEDRAECQKRFHELSAKGQIGFVTFHQSFSYEEFIEGLRPVIKEDDGGVRYEIRTGILKEIALAAIGQSLERVAANRATFEQLWNVLLEKVESETWLLPGIGTSQYKLTLTPSGNLTGENVKGNAQQPYNASRNKIERVWKELRDGPMATHALIIGILKVGSHSNLIGAVVEELKRIEQKLPQAAILLTKAEKSVTAATSFLAGSPDYHTDFQSSPKFVLIIDEINRGNVSKIFGELITLLEDDKRIGEPNELRVTLPTSGEEFALPPNLYILGTMNTADRSLAQLDVALRRRFEFEELAPRPELCDKLALLPEVLTRLNERLEWALDREHRLGHAYFMDVDSEAKFNTRFRSKVVPLLIEYFPHDFATLRAVLGETSNGFLRELARPEGFKSGTKYCWWFETDAKDTFSAFEQLKTNFKIS